MEGPHPQCVLPESYGQSLGNWTICPVAGVGFGHASPEAGVAVGHATTRGSGHTSGAVAAVVASQVGYATAVHFPFTHEESVSQTASEIAPGRGGLSVAHAPPSAITVGHVPASEKLGGPPSSPGVNVPLQEPTRQRVAASQAAPGSANFSA
jgi:hypothetical protein